ncbi:MAG: DUF4897 domain-containing protein [Halorientalis sp.]
MSDAGYLVAGLVVAGVLVAAVGPAAATQSGPTEGLTVDLAADGSAEVTLVLTYDLDSENESDAFRALADDQAARERFARRFRQRIGRVAADAANETGRQMRITNASLAVRTAGDTGVVELSVTWRGLAAVADGTVTLTEPFASGYAADQQVRVVAPEGYELTSVTPEPDARTATTATWDRGSDLSGLEVVATESSGESGPGFSVGVTLVALAAAAAFAARRR